MMHSKPWWLPSLVLALVLPLVGSHSAVPTPHPDFADTLWIAESDRGLKVALSDGRVLFEIPDTGRIEALALNEEAAVLWTYGEGRLSAYDFAGRRLLTRPIDAEGADRHGRSKRGHLVLNPLDGSLWLGVGRRLYHFDPTGEVLQETQLQDPIRALSFDRTRTRLWVGFRRSLTAYDASGQPGQRIEIGRSGKLRDLAYDETLDALWVALEDRRVRRYAPEGGEVQVNAHLSEAFRRLAPDHQGGAWIAAGKHLLRVDDRGGELLKLRPFAGAEKDGTTIKALAVDAREGAVWIASRGAVREVDASGEIKPLLALGADRPKLDLRVLTLYTDGIPPTVAITSPREGHVVPTDRPLFAVSYEDRGIGIDEHLAMDRQRKPARGELRGAGRRCDLYADRGPPRGPEHPSNVHCRSSWKSGPECCDRVHRRYPPPGDHPRCPAGVDHQPSRIDPERPDLRDRHAHPRWQRPRAPSRSQLQPPPHA